MDKAMTFTLEDITPEKANEYLLKNTDNYRNPNTRRVNTYAADMAAGKWEMNGEAIKFDSDGNLVDGQHRLLAIVKANATVKMLVVRGVDTKIMDLGSPRSLGTIARHEGIADANYTTLVALAGFIVGNGDTHRTKGNVAVLDYLAAHAIDLDKAAKATVTGSKPIARKAAVMAAAYTLYRKGEDLNDITNFFKIVNSGLPTGHYEPSSALVFRNTLQEYRLQHDEERKMLFCITVQALKDFLAGKVRTNKYRATMDGFNLLNEIRIEDGVTA